MSMDITCPICHKQFRSDDCPHSVGDVKARASREKQKAIWNILLAKITCEELAKFRS